LDSSEELELSIGALVGYFDPDTGTAGWNDGVFAGMLSLAVAF